jgi:predicted nucleotidyltransferase
MESSKVRPSNNKLIQEATRRIVLIAKPKRVLLFGSAARGRLKKDSDLDMLVVMNAPVHRRRMAQKINRSMYGLGIAVDIIVVTEEDLQKYGQRVGTILKPAIKDGRVLYES